jgi:hypothetical protein
MTATAAKRPTVWSMSTQDWPLLLIDRIARISVRARRQCAWSGPKESNPRLQPERLWIFH